MCVFVKCGLGFLLSYCHAPPLPSPLKNISATRGITFNSSSVMSAVNILCSAARDGRGFELLGKQLKSQEFLEVINVPEDKSGPKTRGLAGPPSLFSCFTFAAVSLSFFYTTSFKTYMVFLCVYVRCVYAFGEKWRATGFFCPF